MVLVLLIPISIIHFGVIPTLTLLILLSMLSRKVLKQHIPSSYQGWVVTVLLLLNTIHMYYTFLVSNPANLSTYITYYINLLHKFIFEPEIATTMITGYVTHGYQRPWFFINALGPASFLSLTLVGIFALLSKIIKIKPIICPNLVQSHALSSYHLQNIPRNNNG